MTHWIRPESRKEPESICEVAQSASDQLLQIHEMANDSINQVPLAEIFTKYYTLMIPYAAVPYEDYAEASQKMIDFIRVMYCGIR